SHDPIVEQLDIYADGFENSKRKVKLTKVLPAYHIYKELVTYYAVIELLGFIKQNKIKTVEELKEALQPKLILTAWVNVGGQFILQSEIKNLVTQINKGRIKGWEEVHSFYIQQGKAYDNERLGQAFAALREVQGINLKRVSGDIIKSLLQESV